MLISFFYKEGLMFIRLASALLLTTLFHVLPAAADCNAEDGCYGALAAASWNDYDGRAKMSVGSAYNHPSEYEADEAARAQCLESSEGNYCEIVGNFSYGACGYITIGTRGGKIRWTSGKDADEVYNRCSSGGYSCNWPIGGCTAEATYGDE